MDYSSENPIPSKRARGFFKEEIKNNQLEKQDRSLESPFNKQKIRQ